jgi:hypothetical protein
MKNLKKQIQNQLEKLHELLDQIQEAQIIQPTEPETWDSDLLYDLAENLKRTLQLLENKLSPKEKDPWGEPLILEEGLCSLVDQYHEEEDYE